MIDNYKWCFVTVPFNAFNKSLEMTLRPSMSIFSKKFVATVVGENGEHPVPVDKRIFYEGEVQGVFECHGIMLFT